MNDNPLKQYFRRPSLYIKLPSQGKYYSQDVLDMPENGGVAIYPMTAIDEITSRTPDALFNGHAVADIIKSCVPCIKDPWKINNIDLDTLLMAIRVASSGENMDINTVCPSCSHEQTYGINLINLISEQQNVDYTAPLKVRELEITFKPLSYSETNKNNLAQYEIQKMLSMLDEIEDQEIRKTQTTETINKLNEIINEALTETIQSITTPETIVTEKHFIKDFLINCDKQTNNLIKDKSISLREKNKPKPLKIRCINCQHDFEQEFVINISDFFE